MVKAIISFRLFAVIKKTFMTKNSYKTICHRCTLCGVFGRCYLGNSNLNGGKNTHSYENDEKLFELSSQDHTKNPERNCCCCKDKL